MNFTKSFWVYLVSVAILGSYLGNFAYAQSIDEGLFVTSELNISYETLKDKPDETSIFQIITPNGTFYSESYLFITENTTVLPCILVDNKTIICGNFIIQSVSL